jgi:phytoene desaturase
MAARGYEVDVYESNTYVGGKLAQIEAGGYRFDAGPSLFTMPQYFEELFRLAGRNFQDYCPYHRLDVITHYFYPDGSRLHAHSDPEKFAREAEERLGVPARKVTKHLQQSKKLYDLTHNIFLNKSLHSVKQQSAREVLKAGRYFRSLDLFRTMHQANRSRFNGNDKMVQLFDRFATYNGSDPYQAAATLNIIPHLEHNIGAFFPKGGMYSLTRSMRRLAEELGVRFHLGQKVEAISTEHKRATGIRVNGRQVEADKVICNVDIMFAYRKLLQGHKAPEQILNQPRSSSALIFYWGIRRKFPELGLHNILFSRDYRKEFKAIFRQKTILDDPTVYINITSKYSPDDAPEGHENWFVMINVPNDEGQDWDRMIPAARSAVIRKISEMLGTEIEPLIEAEDVLEPRTIESRTGSFRGALYGSASNNRMAAFLRHSNFSRKISNLYFCGGSVHPGGGIPLCMLSAKIVDDLMHN